MKSLLTAIALGVAFSTMTTNIALADKGRGGGRTIDIKGRRALMDLVGNKTCFWREGADVAKETPSFAAIIETLREVHWYLASLLESEINAVDICFTAERLPQIPLTDLLGVTVYNERRDQTGIRFNDMVFVQEAHFAAMKKGELQAAPPATLNQLNQMDPRHFKFMAGYFLVHEILHSFIPYEVDRRDNSLWSMTAMIARNHLTRMSPKDFALQVKRNQLEVASDITPLNPYRQAIEIAINPEADIAERTKAAFALTKAFEQKGTLKSLLLRTDLETIAKLAAKESDFRNQKFATALAHGTEEEVIRSYKRGALLTSETKPRSYEAGTTGFQIAIERGFYTYLALLLAEEKVDYSQANLEKGPILLFKLGHPELGLALMKKPEFRKEIFGDSSFSSLESVIKVGWKDAVRFIMDGLPRSAYANRGRIITFAMENNQSEIATLLMTYKFDRFYADDGVLGRLLMGEWSEVFAWLESSGTGVHWSKTDEQILLQAVKDGELQVFRNMSKVEIPESQYNEGYPALERILNLAIALNRQEICLEIFKQKNLRVGFKAPGETASPIDKAIHEGRIEIVKAAIAHPSYKIDPNEYDGPLKEAVSYNFPAAVRALLVLGDRVSTYTLESALSRSPKTSIESRKLVEAALQIRYAQTKAINDAAARRRINQ